MRRDFRLEPAPVAHTLDDARHEGGAVEHAHLLGHADVRVDERVIVRDHVLVGGLRRDRVLEGVSGPLEQEAPEGPVDEVQEGQDAEGPVGWARGGRGGAGEGGGRGRGRHGAVEEEVEEAEAEGVALLV